jgi:hypothetical protein
MLYQRSLQYSTRPDDLVSLKQQGVSDKVIAAMFARGGAPRSTEFSDSAASLGKAYTFQIPMRRDRATLRLLWMGGLGRNI